MEEGMRIHARVPTSITFLAAMTLLVGVVYPALVTAIAQLAFPRQAKGSLITMAAPSTAKGGPSSPARIVGSELLAQEFTSPRFFHARPSATGYAYIGAGASNLGPTSAELAKAVDERRAAWERDFGSPAPEEMLYASGSGLDPEVSLESAMGQMGRVAMARGFGPEERSRLEETIRSLSSSGKGLPAPSRVNVTALNALLETDPALAGRGR
jgi:potassium-transporting ATPase KdpC subunit